jgi:hypothetical protein
MDSRDDLIKRIANLEHKLDTLVEHRVGMLEDIEAIKRLQRMYGYYVDLCLWEPMAELFSDNGAIEIGRRGRYIGRANVMKFLHDVNGGGVSGLRPQQVINHTQHQGIVTVAADRKNAHGRWRAFVQIGAGVQSQPIAQTQAPSTMEVSPAGPPGPPGALTGGAMMYEEGVYENTYVRENGVWKISLLFWVPTYYVTHAFNRMWFESGPASTTVPPQRPPTPPMPGLGRQFLPFHYPHPITGKPVTEILARRDEG